MGTLKRRRRRRVGGGALVRFVAGLVALAGLLIAAMLSAVAAVAALAPATAPFAVTSGSMTPALDVGDVVVARSERADGPDVGDVVVFRPGDEAPARTVTHRVVETLDDGTLVTKGDANPTADTAPLHDAAVVGVAEVVVPWIGSPAAWVANGQWILVAAGLLVLVAAAVLARAALDPGRDPWRAARREPSAPRPPDEQPPSDRRRSRSGTLRLAALVVVGAAVAAANPSGAGFSARASTSSNDVAAATSFPCTRFPTLTYLTGMETGAVAGSGVGLHDSFSYESISRPPDNTSVRARTGSYSMVIPKAGGGRVFVGANQGAPVVVDRYALRFDTLPTQRVVQLASIVPASGARINLGYDAASRRFTFGFAGSASAVSTVTAVAGQWHVIEYRVDVSTSTRTADWRIDGSAQPGSSSSEGASTIATANLGSETSGDVFTAYYDDLARSQTASDYPLGDGRVVALHPDGVDTSTANGRFAVGGASSSTVDASSFGVLRMATPNTYIEQTTSDAAASLGVSFDDTPVACVRGVMAVAELQSNSIASNLARTSVVVGGAEQVLRHGSHNSEMIYIWVPLYYPSYQQRVLVPPGGQWTTSALNAVTARFGYGSDVDPRPRWSGLVLHVDTRLAPS